MNPVKLYRMCTSKSAFGRRQAERKAFWYGMRAYKCPACHRWHLTSQL